MAKHTDETHRLGVLYESLQSDMQRMLELMTVQHKEVMKIPKIEERLSHIRRRH